MDLLGQLIKVIVMEFVSEKVGDVSEALIQTAEDVLDALFDN